MQAGASTPTGFHVKKYRKLGQGEADALAMGLQQAYENLVEGLSGVLSDAYPWLLTLQAGIVFLKGADSSYFLSCV